MHLSRYFVPFVLEGQYHVEQVQQRLLHLPGALDEGLACLDPFLQDNDAVPGNPRENLPQLPNSQLIARHLQLVWASLIRDYNTQPRLFLSRDELPSFSKSFRNVVVVLSYDYHEVGEPGTLESLVGYIYLICSGLA